MKKSLVLLLILSIFLLGCIDNKMESSPVDTEYNQDEPAVINIPGLEVEPIVINEREILPLPEDIDLNADVMDFVNTIIYQPTIAYTEIAGDSELSYNISGGITNDGSAFEFTANTDARIDISKPLNEYASGNEKISQAVLIKFMPINCYDLRFTYENEALGPRTITFLRTGVPDFVMDFAENLANEYYGGRYEDYYNHEFEYADEGMSTYLLEQNEWNYVLMTVDDESYRRYVVWKDGEVENAVYDGKRQFRDDYYLLPVNREQEPIFYIEFAAGGTLLIEQYWILEYEVLTK